MGPPVKPEDDKRRMHSDGRDEPGHDEWKSGRRYAPDTVKLTKPSFSTVWRT